MPIVTVDGGDLPEIVGILIKYKMSFKIIFTHPNIERILRATIKIPVLNKAIWKVMDKANSTIMKNKVLISW
ncbi:MAG: hypothetical protein QXP45_03315 [Thermoproteota archaeon]